MSKLETERPEIPDTEIIEIGGQDVLDHTENEGDARLDSLTQSIQKATTGATPDNGDPLPIIRERGGKKTLEIPEALSLAKHQSATAEPQQVPPIFRLEDIGISPVPTGRLDKITRWFRNFFSR